MKSQISSAPADASSDASALSFAGAARKVAQRVVRRIEAYADYAAEAAIYENLSRLSDAELKHRGLSRGNLAHDVRATRDRTG